MLAGCGGTDTRTADYVRSVCTTMTAYAEQFYAETGRYSVAPSPATTGLEAYVAALRADTATALRGLRQAGAPAAGVLIGSLETAQSDLTGAADSLNRASARGRPHGVSAVAPGALLRALDVDEQLRGIAAEMLTPALAPLVEASPACAALLRAGA